MDAVDCVVVGAGVVGLAVARALARAGRETLILEKATSIGSGVSSRNSGVIHGGIYYPEGTLKARLCASGNPLLYRYCAEHGVAYRRCGKLIVAITEPEIAQLASIRHAAEGNGLTDLVLLEADQAKRLEPELSLVGALLSPSTGIVDSHGLMLSLQGDAEDAGAVIAFGAEVTSGGIDERGLLLWTNGEVEPALRAQLLVNASGIFATQTARRIAGFPAAHIPRSWFAKGNYFMLNGRAPFSRLIYPAPEPGGLGVHLTIDLAGQARFGPDVEWLDTVSSSGLTYDVDPGRAAQFYDAIRRYWPHLRDGRLSPGYSGIRPKLSGPGQPAADFYIGGPSTHGVAGIINLFGIESPGLTASLAIANEVVRLAKEAHDA